jgi:pimeloyl-ACP methyl ester carboxylesterase
MKPYLLLHGALGSEYQLTPLKEALQHEGFSVLTMTFSGHGGQPFENEFHIEKFADEVLQFLDQQKIPKANIFGYSMGGYVALYAALIKPQYIGHVITLGTKFDWSPESASRELRKLDAQRIQDKIPAFASVLRERHHPEDWKLVLQKTAQMMQRLGESPVLTADNLKKINRKVIVLLGDADDMVDRSYSQIVAETLPQGEFRLLPETLHPIEKIKIETLVKIISELGN